MIEDTEYDTFAKYRGGWGGKVYKLIQMTGYDEKHYYEIIVSLGE